MNIRFANKHTILPRGGGPDGTSPVLLPKGAGIVWSVYHLHRLESLYGADAREFRPETWEATNCSRRCGRDLDMWTSTAVRGCAWEVGEARLFRLIPPLTSCKGLHPHRGKLRDDQDTADLSRYKSYRWRRQQISRQVEAVVHHCAMSFGRSMCGIILNYCVQSDSKCVRDGHVLRVERKQIFAFSDGVHCAPSEVMEI
jgi:hypothetical protein